MNLSNSEYLDLLLYLTTELDLPLEEAKYIASLRGTENA